ncbi:MAG: hypothetical protein CMH52_09090 [Myxococcales bacterium]|nr:hypothetical protein [Myxococcales bacterium]
MPSIGTESAPKHLRGDLRVILGLTVLIFAPSIFTGVFADDYFHRLILSGQLDAYGVAVNPFLDLFSFIPADGPPRDLLTRRGFEPWWLASDVYVQFFRPITAVTHIIDYTVWPNVPALHHIHSLLWMCLLVWTLKRLYLATGMSGLSLGLGLFFFAVDDAHMISVAWLANRNVIIAGVFSALAIESYVKWINGEVSIVRSLFWLTMAALSAEAGYCAIGYMVAWSLVYCSSWKARLTSPIPAALILVLVRASTHILGYGTNGLSLYTDPLNDPLTFFVDALARFPVLIGGLWLQFPTELSALASPAQLMMVSAIIAVLLVPILHSFFVYSLVHKQTRFWLLGTVLSCLPLLAAIPMNRLLLIPSIGFCAALAQYLTSRPTPWRHWLYTLHGPVAIGLCLVSYPLIYTLSEQTQAAHAFEGSKSGSGVSIYINGSAFHNGIHILADLEEKTRSDQQHVFLSHLFRRQTIVRRGPRTIEVSNSNGWFQSTIERAFYDRHNPFTVGDRLPNSVFTARIMAVTEDGRPSAVQFTFKHSLESERYQWVCFTNAEFKQCTPPKLGEILILDGLL